MCELTPSMAGERHGRGMLCESALRVMLTQLAGSRTWKFNAANTKATSNLHRQSLITLCPPPRYSTTCTAHSTSSHRLLHKPPPPSTSHVIYRCSRSFLSVQTRYFRTFAAHIIANTPQQHAAMSLSHQLWILPFAAPPVGTVPCRTVKLTD